MPEQTNVAAQYAGALANPVRRGIVAALLDGPRTVESLARRLEVSPSRVARAARALETMGLLRVSEGPPRTLELLRAPIVHEDVWEQIPLPLRRSSVASTLTQVHAAATDAVDAGGFDRPDMYLTRTSMRVTEEHWREAATLFRDTLARLGELSEKADADESPDPRLNAMAVLMLFSRDEHGSDASSDDPVPEFGEREARERTYGLVEALQGEVVAPRAAWERVAALAEQLRLVARAAMNVEDAARGPAPTQRVADR